MASRILARNILPTRLCCLSTIGNNASQMRQFFNRNPRNLPEVFFGSTSNIFRELEKEFDRMQRQFDNYFRNSSFNDNRSLVNYSEPNADGKNMIVTESDGSRKFYLAFDMRGFEPEEVKIKTHNGTLTVSAKKEKKAANSYSLHEFSQTYTLPEELKIDDLKSTFAENGILAIEAPLPKQESKDRQIQIEHKK